MLLVADRLTPVDVLGLVGFMIAGLAAVGWEKRVGPALFLIAQPSSRLRARAAPAKSVLARILVVVMGAWISGTTALCLVGVLKLRPEGNPLPALLGGIGALGLLALVAVAVRAVVAIIRDAKHGLR